MILDLSKVTANTFLPEGATVCMVADVRDTTSKDKGTPMVEVTLRDQRGRSERVNLVATEKALFRIKAFALAAGFTEEQTHKLDTRNFKGKAVTVFKEKKGMRMIPTDTGPKEVTDYEITFGPAESTPIGSSKSSDAMALEDIGF